MSAHELITEHLDLWTQAVTQKSTAGRGSNGKVELTGIKRLRELILELAVRGKLVEQYPGDEPASKLLEHIKQEVERQIRAGQRKKPKPTPRVSEKEVPFQIPSNWTWVRLGALCELENGDRSKNYPNKSALVKAGIPFVNAGHIKNFEVNREEMTFISEDRFNLLRSGKFREGDILFCLRGSLGKAGVVKGMTRGAIASSLIIARPILEQSEYILLYLKAPLSAEMIKKYDNGTAQPNLSGKDFGSFLVPVPPEEEQHRIVQKVDELMALCDRLEQHTSDQLEAHETLVDTLLGTLTQSGNATELADNWARVAAHFDALFTTEQSIDKLKQTILQLAVMGRLVEQDAGDEPAVEVIKRAHERKIQLLSEKLIKKQKELPDITEPEKPFSTPPLWAYARLDDICTEVTSGSTPAKSEFSETFGIPYLKVYNIRSQRVNFDYKPQYVTENYHRTTLKRSQLLPGDVVMNIVGPPLGKTAIIPDDHPEWNCNQAIVRFRPIEIELNQFIHLYLKAGIFLKTIELIGTAGQDNISVTKSRSIVIPLPPKAEQHRIVQKVDELMALCDQLKEHLNQASDTRCQLSGAVVDGALN